MIIDKFLKNASRITQFYVLFFEFAALTETRVALLTSGQTDRQTGRQTERETAVLNHIRQLKVTTPRATCDGLLLSPNAVAAISSEWWGDRGLGAESPAGSRGKVPGQGVGGSLPLRPPTKMLGDVSPRLPYSRRHWLNAYKFLVFIFQ